jgi:hypothetical protein
MKIYLLSSGLIGDGSAAPEAAFTTKKAMLAYIKKEYPDARGTNRMEKDELYWEYELGWVMAEKIPFFSDIKEKIEAMNQRLREP